MRRNITITVLFLLTLFVFPQNTYAEFAKSSSASLDTRTKKLVIDNRAEILGEYLNSFNSPLAPYAATFVKEADKNQIDWKLVAAISGVESTFGHHIPPNSYNGWGWGIYGNNIIRFSSWDEAIATISKGIREKYINDWGATNVYEIGRIYAASPTWAVRVEYFMKKIEAFEENHKIIALSIAL